ncbi:hypothetical protein ES708_05102 [subsurface metagenome]
MKKKLLSVLLVLVLVLSFSLVTAVPAAAKGPVGETVTINWLEDAWRYSPDGSLLGSWTDDSIGPADLVRTGKAYHFASIQEYYNYPGLENLSGSLVISGAGKLSGHATYTSPASGLPIRDRFQGEVNIDADEGTMEGTYTQWSYAFGANDEVLASYPQAVPAKKQGSGWWFIGYTEYTAHQ